ncbi:MAG: TetR/AcrR family transcriptional regulator, partial [Jatrophihabitans sp.]
MSAPRLPRGRHKLSREQVAAAQRSRMITATAEAMAERGYVNTPVAEIIKRAGVSRETFYQQFGSKQDCFVAALEEALGGLSSLMASLPEQGTPIERFERLIGAYLGVLAGAPQSARLFLIEVYAAGPAVSRRRTQLQQPFVDGLAQIFGATSARGRFAVEALVAAIVSLVTAR